MYDVLFNYKFKYNQELKKKENIIDANIYLYYNGSYSISYTDYWVKWLYLAITLI